MGTKTSDSMSQNKPFLLKGVYLLYSHHFQNFWSALSPKDAKPKLTDII